MKKRLLTGIVFASVMVIGALASAQDASSSAQDASPTAAEVSRLIDQKKYHDALTEIEDHLEDPSIAVDEKYTLLMLRGETLIRTGADQSAARAFEEASKTGVQHDKQMDALALKSLVDRSPDLSYIPRHGEDRTPIPLVQKDRRLAAFGAALSDALTNEKSRLDEAMKSTDLADINAEIPNLKALGGLEWGANGDTSRTDQMVQQLAEYGHKMVGSSLDTMARRVVELARISGNWQGYGWGRQGLTGQQGIELRDIASKSDEVGKTLDAADAFAAQDKKFDALRDESKEVGERAREVFSGTFDESPITLSDGSSTDRADGGHPRKRR